MHYISNVTFHHVLVCNICFGKCIVHNGFVYCFVSGVIGAFIAASGCAALYAMCF